MGDGDVPAGELVLEVQEETSLRPSLRLVVRSGQVLLPHLEVGGFQQAADYDDVVVRRLGLAGSVIDPDYAPEEPAIA